MRDGINKLSEGGFFGVLVLLYVVTNQERNGERRLT